jgi:hypothetical protein
LRFVSCQFLPPGGGMDLSMFYLAKNHKIDVNSTTTEAGEKNTDLESLDIKKKLLRVSINLKIIIFFLIN